MRKIDLSTVDKINLQLQYDINVDENSINLFGDESYDMDTNEPGVEYKMANKFIRGFRLLEQLNPKKRILIHMKTCGGHWTEGMAIYDTINNSKNSVTIISYTHARSMSSIILQAADRRVLMPHSYFLYHEGTLALSGNYRTVVSEVLWQSKCAEQMLEIYAGRIAECRETSGRKDIKEQLQRDMEIKDDVFLTPTNAIAYGFADEIYDFEIKY